MAISGNNDWTDEFKNSLQYKNNVPPPNSFTANFTNSLTTNAIQNSLNQSIQGINPQKSTIPLAPGMNPTLLQGTIPGSIEELLGGAKPLAPSTTSSPGEFKVRLVSVLDMLNNAPGDIKRVIFEVTPTLSETQGVEYASVQPIHMPGGIQVYKFTNPRQFEVSAHFISRSVADALLNMRYVQTLRSWTRPFFGQSETNITPKPGLQQAPSNKDSSAAGIEQIQGASNKDGVNLLGAPPEVLYLYGYSTVQNDARQGMSGINLNRIPVVITNLSINFAEDVDYLPVNIFPDAHTEPFPVKLDVSITLVETHSPTEYERFSLDAFKSGTLRSF